MAYSKFTIDFIEVPIVGKKITITENKLGIIITENFKEQRLALNQVKVPLFIPDDGLHPDRYLGYISANYKDAFNLDYNSSNLFTVTVVNGNVNSGIGSVTVEANYADADFEITYTDTNASILIENSTQDASIAINSFLFSAYSPSLSAKCLVNVNTTPIASSFYLNNDLSTQVSNLNNPFTYEILRGSNQLLTVVDSLGNKDSVNVVAPDILSIGNASVSLLSEPNGNTATISIVEVRGLTLEYSLNNINWQLSNVFSGLLPGSYTFYIKDQFGYVVQKVFTVSAFSPVLNNIQQAFSYLSKAMSIRFKRNQVIDYIDTYKNDNNTLSCEENVFNAYKYIQRFRSSNLVTTQLLSNYSNIVCSVVKQDGSKDILILDKKINFLDIEDKRDARYYWISSTKVGIYFTSGNIYKYGVADEIESTFVLNGALPNYGLVGNYVKINNSQWLEIKDVIYNDNLESDVLVFDLNVADFADTAVVVSSKYNQKVFNVYEFTIDFAKYNDQTVKVEILQQKEGFEDYNYLSELIEVSDYHERNVELIWYNNIDTSVFYSTGIKNIGNFELVSFESSNDSGLEIHKTPSTSIVIEASNYELKELLIEDLSTGIMQQLVQASLHKHILVDRVRYISNDKPDVEVVKFTNMHSVTLSLIKTGEVYNSNLVGDSNINLMAMPGS